MSYEKVMGNATVNTFGKFYPNNATTRPNTINGQNLNNGMPSAPKNFNEGLAKEYENLHILADNFEWEVQATGEMDYRKYFSKDIIPQHMQALSKTYMKSTGIDERPETAAITGLDTWSQTMNEVSITGSSIEVGVNAYGRFYKQHRLADDIMKIRWYEEIARKFSMNASRTLNNLAGLRAYNGSNKLFVSSVSNYDENNPLTPRLSLTSSAASVDAYLTWDALKEAIFLMQNYEEPYAVVESSGSITTKKRRKAIGGYYGSAYAVVLSYNGYLQLLADEEFRKTYVVNGGYYAEQTAQGQLGINMPFLQMKFDIISNPITISKAATPVVATDGSQELEVCFVIGGNPEDRTAVELSLEGWTKMITVSYDEDRKVDFFGLLQMVGWIAVVDFAIIRPECWYAIPYKKNMIVSSGTPTAPTDPTWKP